MCLYVIHDKLAVTSSAPFPAVNDGTAMRIFRSSVKNNEFPDDFQLFRIGTITEDGLYISPLSKPEEIKGV